VDNADLSTQSNKELVVRYLDAMHDGNLEVVSQCVAEDVTRFGPRPSSVYAAPVRGRAEFLAQYHGPDYYQMGTLKMEVERIVAEGDFVAVQFILRAMTRKGDPYENYYHFLFECVRGTIKTIWEYIDTLYAHRMFFD
jgi:ketosteroid isomerase-like protein